MVGGLVLTVSSAIAPIACVGSESAIEVKLLPPSVLIHTPPPDAPIKSRPPVVGSGAIATTRPLASKVAPLIGPPKLGSALFIGCGPINCQEKPLAAVVLSAVAACIWRIALTARAVAPGGMPNCKPRREFQ